MILNVTKENFDKEVLQAEGTVRVASTKSPPAARLIKKACGI